MDPNMGSRDLGKQMAHRATRAVKAAPDYRWRPCIAHRRYRSVVAAPWLTPSHCWHPRPNRPPIPLRLLLPLLPVRHQQPHRSPLRQLHPLQIQRRRCHWRSGLPPAEPHHNQSAAVRTCGRRYPLAGNVRDPSLRVAAPGQQDRLAAQPRMRPMRLRTAAPLVPLPAASWTIPRPASNQVSMTCRRSSGLVYFAVAAVRCIPVTTATSDVVPNSAHAVPGYLFVAPRRSAKAVVTARAWAGRSFAA